MRQRLVQFFQRPIPGTENLWSKIFQPFRKLATRLFKPVIWFLCFLIGLSLIWIVVGNAIATQQEKRVDRALEQYINQFPKTDTNNSAMKFEELYAGLGLGQWMGVYAPPPTRYIHLPPKAKKKSFQDISNDINDYLESQYDKLNDEIDIPPENIRQYLADLEPELEAIRTHILNSEMPRWEMQDVVRHTGDLQYPLPSFLNLANFNRITAVDILEKTRQGKTKEALKSLEVAWTLNQSLLEHPSLISQIVFIINSTPIAVVMRKIEGIPTEWQERIAIIYDLDFPKTFLSRGLYSEAFLSISARKYSFLDSSIDILNTLPSSNFLNIVAQNLHFNILLKPYFRLASVDLFDQIRRAILKLPEYDFCTNDQENFLRQEGLMPAWWNPNINYLPFSGQWNKVSKVRLKFELTKKVIQIKEIALREGKLPNQIQGIDSSSCKNAKWIYQLASDGTGSIAFSKEFDWLKSKTDTNQALEYLPGDRLMYSFKPKKSNQTATAM